MKKLFTLLLAMVMLLSLAACGGQSAPAPTAAPEAPATEAPAAEVPVEEAYTYPELTLQYGTTAAEGSLSVNAMYDFAEKVSAATNGNIVIDIYPGGQLGKSNDLLEQCQLGTLAMTNSSPAQMTNAGVPEMAVLGMPYLYRDYEHYWNVLFGEVGAKYLDVITEKCPGVVGFGYYADGARHFFLNTPIESLADMKGLKIRVQDTSIDNAWCTALGANPTPTATSEIYSSMSNGLVDGAEQPLAGYYSSKYYEVSKYLILDGHTYNLLIPIFSESVWNSLDENTQKMLKDCWAQTMEEQHEIIVNTQNDLIKQIEEAGVQVGTPADLADWAAAMDGVYAEFGAGYEAESAEIQAVK